MHKFIRGIFVQWRSPRESGEANHIEPSLHLPRNLLPCTCVGDRPIDGYSGNEEITMEWTALDRPYACKYLLDGWKIDASPDAYFAQCSNSSVWGFSNGSAGSVVVAYREKPFDPPLADEYSVGLHQKSNFQQS